MIIGERDRSMLEGMEVEKIPHREVVDAKDVLAKIDRFKAAHAEVTKQLETLSWKDKTKQEMLRTLGGMVNYLDRLRDVRFEGTEFSHVPDRLFISYSHANSKFAEKVVNEADTRGIRTWFDQRHLVGSTMPHEGRSGEYHRDQGDLKDRVNYNDSIQRDGMPDSSHAVFLITPEAIAKFDEIKKEILGALEDKDKELIFVFAPDGGQDSKELRNRLEGLLDTIKDPRLPQALQAERSIDLLDTQGELLPKVLAETEARAKLDEAGFRRKKERYQEQNALQPIRAIDKKLYTDKYNKIIALKQELPTPGEITNIDPSEREEALTKINEAIRELGETVESEFTTYKPESVLMFSASKHKVLANNIGERLQEAGVIQQQDENKAEALVFIMDAAELHNEGFGRDEIMGISRFMNREQAAKSKNEYLLPQIIPVWIIQKDSKREIAQMRSSLGSSKDFGDYMAIVVDKDATPDDITRAVMERSQLEAKYSITQGKIDAQAWDYNRIKRKKNYN